MTRRAGFTYTELLCVLATIAVVWMLFLPSLVRARSRADEVNCVQRLRNISLALRMYSQDHSGHLPPGADGLQRLVPRYLHDYDVLRCPGAMAREKVLTGEALPAGPSAVDYAYRPGLAGDDHPSEAVAWDDEPRHRDGGNVIYLSGRAAWLDGLELERLAGSGAPAAGGGDR